MLHTISWQGYWTSLALLTAVYYLTICLLYFRKEVTILFYRKLLSPDKATPLPSVQKPEGAPTENNQLTLFGEEVTEEFSRPPADSEEHMVYSLMDEVHAFFEEAKKRKWQRQELTHTLKTLLLKYPSLKSSEYKEAISNVLLAESEHHCSIHLSAEELAEMWSE